MGEYLLCERGFVPTITTVVERETAQRVRYHPSLRSAEDIDFAIRLALEGCRFKMAGTAGRGLERSSRSRPCLVAWPGRAFRRLAGADASRSYRRAWHGARGWAYAKMLARNGRKLEALRLYLTALRHRCYRPRLAAVIFLQIFWCEELPRAWPISGSAGSAWACASHRRPGAPGNRASLSKSHDDAACGAGRWRGLRGVARMRTSNSDGALRALAAAKGILFGSAAATYELRDADFVALLPREAAILVPEYEMKRNVTEPAAGTYDFSGCDALMNFAQTHEMQMRGHPLVWHYANPPWLEEAVRASATRGC